MFPGGYDYCSVEVNGTEYTSVTVPLIYMAAGLQQIDNAVFIQLLRRTRRGLYYVYVTHYIKTDRQ